MKHKTILKFIVVIGIMLLATILIGATKVQAVEITDETLQEVANILPNKIQLDLKEVEYEKATATIVKEVEKSLNSNNITYNKKEEWGYPTYNLQGEFENISFSINDIHFYSIEGIREYYIYLRADSSNKYNNKKIELVYNNSDKYNKADEQIVKNLKITPAGYYEVELNKYTSFGNMFEVAGKYYMNMVNDSSITIKAYAGAGGDGKPLNLMTGESGTYIAIFRNGILYDVRGVGNDITIPSITIPSNISEDKINEYILNIVKPEYKSFIEMLSETEEISFDESKIKVSKGAIYHFRESVSVNKDGTLNEKYRDITIPNGYTISYEGMEEDGYLIARRETSTSTITKTDTSTNIKLETTSNVVPENTQLEVKKLTTGNTYSIVEKAINNEVSKFVLYDITLKSNNTTIQPNGKVKISIPIPNGYDTSKIVVYRIAENGTKTKYDTTINNGYVTFETDHFNNYVVAEETTTTNNGSGTTTEPTETPKQPTTKPTTSGKLDDTPKTGADNTMSVISSIVSVLSIIGIAILKKF